MEVITPISFLDDWWRPKLNNDIVYQEISFEQGI